MRRGFWAGTADFDFWYAVTAEDTFWLRLRRQQEITLAVSLFFPGEGLTELDLYDLSAAPVTGLRATLLNTPLITLNRFEPPLPVVALQLKDGHSHFFTLPRTPESLADQWLAEVLRKVHAALVPRWHLEQMMIVTTESDLAAFWPAWAGPCPR